MRIAVVKNPKCGTERWLSAENHPLVFDPCLDPQDLGVTEEGSYEITITAKKVTEEPCGSE